MPSEMMNPRGSSPSYFPEEGVCFSNAGQVGAQKMDHMSGYYGSKAGETLSTSSALKNRVLMDSQMKNGLDFPEYYLNHGQNVNLWLGKRFVGADRSLPNGPGHDAGVGTNLTTGSASYLLSGDKISLSGAQYEKSLFSSSMSDLFIRKLKLPLNSGAVYGQSVGASHYEEEAAIFESLEELEAQTIGNLLPDDDDLLSGVTDGFDNRIRRNNVEDLDLFSSVGGLELGEDGSSLSGMMNSTNQLGLSMDSSCGKHPLGAYPSRTLFVRNINSSIEDSELKMFFEQYGDVRTMYALCKHRGFVMISYYDIRASCNAMKALQGKLLRSRKLDIHFSIPKENSLQKDINLGAIVVFNLDSSVSNDELHKIFGVYGDIKEIREAPRRSHHKFVEFYDIRAAESALCALNRSDIAGKQIKLEPGWPVGPKRLMSPFSLEVEQEFQLQQHSAPSHLATEFSGSFSLGGITLPSSDNGNIIAPDSAKRGSTSPLMDNVFYHGVSSSIPNGLFSKLVRDESGNHYSITESDHLPSHLKFDIQDAPSLHPHSLPEYYYNNNGLSNGTSFGSPSTNSANCFTRLPEVIDKQQFGRFSFNRSSIEFNDVFCSSGSGSCPSQYIWGNNSHHSQPQTILWPNSPSFVNGISAGLPQQLHAVHRAPPSHMLNGFLSLNNHQHHVGSASSINPSLLDRRHSYAGDSLEACSAFHLPGGSLMNSLISGNNSQQHHMDFIPHSNIFPQTGGGMPESIGLPSHHRRSMGFSARGHQVIPMVSSFDSPNERSRNIRRNEGSFDNKKQFELDVDKILRGDDKRTTLMIKNIPNKYTSKMLLSAIDERHRGTYDFIYLPIDFKNKCNVGYAFINITDPSFIVPFYQTINGKKWEKFNSEKVATLAYARIQGKAALIAHFQNSSLMNEDKRCRPILFHTDGPNAGDQVPFPGTNIQQRTGKNQAINEEHNQKEMPTNSLNREEFSNGDYSSCSSLGKESD